MLGTVTVPPWIWIRPWGGEETELVAVGGPLWKVDVMDALCPACARDTPLVAQAGSLDEWICPRCDGRFLPDHSARTLLEKHHGLTFEQLSSVLAGAPRSKRGCPACHQQMNRLLAKGKEIDVCANCGGLWLDSGELGVVGEGRFEEVSLAASTGSTQAVPSVFDGCTWTRNEAGELSVSLFAPHALPMVGCVPLMVAVGIIIMAGELPSQVRSYAVLLGIAVAMASGFLWREPALVARRRELVLKWHNLFLDREERIAGEGHVILEQQPPSQARVRVLVAGSVHVLPFALTQQGAAILTELVRDATGWELAKPEEVGLAKEQVVATPQVNREIPTAVHDETKQPEQVIPPKTTTPQQYRDRGW